MDADVVLLKQDSSAPTIPKSGAARGYGMEFGGLMFVGGGDHCDKFRGKVKSLQSSRVGETIRAA